MIKPSMVPTTEAVEVHYDSLEWFYLDTWGAHLHHGLWEDGTETTEEAVRNLLETITVLAGIQPGDSVCDIGCGHGGAAIHLAKTRKARVSGITLSKEQFKEAEKRASQLDNEFPVPRFFHGDWLENAFGPGAFDAAISIECLSHIEDKVSFFHETARVLKPGGRLGIAVWLSNPEASSFAIRFLLEPICRDGRFPGLLNASELKALASEAGFTVEADREVSQHVKKTWRVIFCRLIWKVFTRREYQRFLWKTLRTGQLLPLTIVRVLLAYEVGALEYGLFGLINKAENA